MAANIWEDVLERLRAQTDQEDFRRWFRDTSYASDSGDLVTVWVPTEATRRHVALHFQDQISRALTALGRASTQIRFIVAGLGDDEDDVDDHRSSS